MNTEQIDENRLWSYIDGSSISEERSAIKKLLQENEAWKSKYHELLEIHHLIQSSELEEPSLRFSKNLMEKITLLHIAPSAKSYINGKIIWGLGIFFMALFIGCLAYGFGQVDWNVNGDITISQNLDNLNLSKFFNNAWVNAFMMINVVLGLLLFDNYLANKRKQFK